MKAVVLNQLGNTRTLTYAEHPEPTPGVGEVLVEVSAAGVNFMDLGVLQGTIWSEMPNPKVIGVEGAGRVVALGENVSSFSIGQRVAWVYAPGSFAQLISVPASSLVHIPDSIDSKTAAAVMMQGLTASHFATDFYRTQSGDVAFVHAAAGGLGLLLTQIIKMRGGKVIGRVSSKDKVEVAIAAGADHVIVDKDGEFVSAVRELTAGQGVNVVFDGSGPTTFKGSLDILRPSGTLCWYGPVLGGPGPIDIMSLPKSIKLGYAVYFDHVSTPELLRERAAQLFDWIAKDQISVHVGGQYLLRNAEQALMDMASRSTKGKLVLVP